MFAGLWGGRAGGERNHNFSRAPQGRARGSADATQTYISFPMMKFEVTSKAKSG